MTLPVFETPRLTLRAITEHDADGLHEAYGDAVAMRHWDHRRFAGAINYHARNESQRRLAVGWIVVPPFWRQGLVTDAAPPVLSHCFTQLGVHRIEARIEPDNLSSRRLAATLGFTEDGMLRDWLCVAGEFRSIVMYSLLRPEWMTQQRSRSC